MSEIINFMCNQKDPSSESELGSFSLKIFSNAQQVFQSSYLLLQIDALDRKLLE